MADRKWETLNLQATFPPELTEVSNAITQVTSTLSEALTTAREALNIARQLVSLVEGNPVETAIRLVLDEIEKLLLDLLNNSLTVHLIGIPFQKRNLGIAPDLSFQTNRGEFIPRFRNLLDSGAFANRNASTIPNGVVNFIDNASRASGGVQGFWKTFMLSLKDEGDLNRPQFNNGYAVAGLCIVAGGTDITTLIPNIRLLERLFRLNQRTDLAAGTRPTPPVIQARVVGCINSTSGVASISVTWPRVLPLRNSPQYTTSVYKIQDIFLIRSTDSSFRGKFEWSDVFNREPNDERSDLQTEGETSVVARIANDGFVAGHIDLGVSVGASDVYYYAIALRYSVNDVVQPMSNFSNCVRVDLRSAVFSRASALSTPPDWISAGGLFSSIPLITDVVNTVLGALNFLRTRSFSNTGIAATITALINQLDNLITTIEGIIEIINDLNAKIAAILTASVSASLAITLIDVPTGGMDAWSAELAKRLSDDSDSSKPQFNPTDLVTGLVLVAGAPTFGQIEPFIKILEMLFSNAADAVLDAIKSLEREAAPPATPPVLGPALTTPVSKAGLDATLRPSNNPVC